MNLNVTNNSAAAELDVKAKTWFDLKKKMNIKTAVAISMGVFFVFLSYLIIFGR